MITDIRATLKGIVLSKIAYSDGAMNRAGMSGSAAGTKEGGESSSKAGGTDHLSDSTRFAEDLGADSLSLVETMMDIERAFSIEVSDDEAAKVKTFGDMVKLVEKKLEGKSGE